MVPAAPGRFSITNGWRSCSDIFCMIGRATKSGLPPAGVGMMMRTGFDGQAGAATCAAAGVATPANSSAMPARPVPRRRAAGGMGNVRANVRGHVDSIGVSSSFSCSAAIINDENIATEE